jgi:hypothetical protein
MVARARRRRQGSAHPKSHMANAKPSRGFGGSARLDRSFASVMR